jgi:K+-transporting ATPase ATPase A chain
MTAQDWIQIILISVVIGGAAPVVGHYLAWVFTSPRIAPERFMHRLIGTDPDKRMDWREYAGALLLSNGIFFAAGFLLLWAQQLLPLNPRHLSAMSPEVTFNTAASFVTNTNWQAYVGESQLSNFSQMVPITFLMFVGANTGMAALIAIIRGFIRSGASSVGNFWDDFFRFFVRAFLPACVVMALVLVWQGVPQTLTTSVVAHPLEGGTQTLILGPVASLEAVKNLGTNGGGFYNANAAHPFENPTPFTNSLEFLAMLTFTASLPFLFGRLSRRPRQGWALFAAIMIMYAVGFGAVEISEKGANPLLAPAGIAQTTTPFLEGGNTEGKEMRLGITQTSLFSNTTIAATTGAVDASMDSMNPLALMVYFSHMWLNEEPGGKGVGFAGLLKEVVLAIFIAGLMVGRTPEFLGKKLEAREIKLAALSLIVTPFIVLLLTALGVTASFGTSSMNNPGPHGFEEVLYAYSSGNANNGSAMAGLNAATPFYADSVGIEMLLSRYLPLLPLLALAGALARKKIHPDTAGTLSTDTPLFVGLLVGFMVLVGLLTFFPALMLGPILENLSMMHGISF